MSSFLLFFRLLSSPFITFLLFFLPLHLLFQSSHSFNPSPLLPFISPTHYLLFLSLQAYSLDADKCDGPLAGSPVHLALGRHFTYCINPQAFLPAASSPSYSCRMLIHRGMVAVRRGPEALSDGCGPVVSALMRGKRLRPGAALMSDLQ